MIISASRRTDIPAFYFDWFLNRLKEGFALMPNPRNADRLGRVELSSDKVDCIVFWTKNPLPMLDQLKQLDAMGYRYYIQFTLTPYDKAVERGLPPNADLIQAFTRLSKQTSSKQVVWRYDSVLIDREHTVDWQVEQFSRMCGALSTYTERCVLSFIDPYKSLGNTFRAMTPREMAAIAAGFSKIAAQYGLPLFTCAEEIDLSAYGIAHGACIDKGLVEGIVGSEITAKSDANQRAACRCIQSVDIGAYDTCPHGCTYCYATSSRKTVLERVAAHDPKAPMLTGWPRGDEIVTDRTTLSQIADQLRLF